MVERRRRLIEEKNRRIGRQRLYDFEELSLRRVQVADHRVRGYLKIKLGDEGLSPGLSAPQGRMTILRAEDEVVGDGQFSDEGIVLIDGGKCEAARQHWIGAC